MVHWFVSLGIIFNGFGIAWLLLGTTVSILLYAASMITVRCLLASWLLALLAVLIFFLSWELMREPFFEAIKDVCGSWPEEGVER